MYRLRNVIDMRKLYSLAMRLAVPVLLAQLLWRSRQVPGYRSRWRQRLGFALPSQPPDAPAPIWLHAVSVGETLAIAPLIDALLRERPGVPVLVTSTTPTGAAQVARLFGDRVLSCWMPFDTPGAVRRMLCHFRPCMIGLVETELWPNLIAESTLTGVPVLLLNARLSARSARGYACVAPLVVPAVAALSVIAAQHVADARRFRVLGARAQRVQVVGSVKYDLDLPSLIARCETIRGGLGPVLASRRLLVAASTHPGEEASVMSAFRHWLTAVPNGVLLLAPRHPERVSQLLDSGIFNGFSIQRRSAGMALAKDTRILLWDTLGELGAAMGLAEAAFIGGSLVPHGGHNPLEAAVWGIPVLSGPHTHNFATIYHELRRAGSVIDVCSDKELTDAFDALANPAGAVHQQGLNGRRVVDRHRGSLERQLELISRYLDSDAVGAGGATR